MATIRKRGQRYQVQVRRRGHSPLSKSFRYLEDAKLWARQTEAEADRATLPNRKALDRMTLKELVERYMDIVVPRKRGAEIETIILSAFLRDYRKLAEKPLSSLTAKDFASYRDERLKTIQPSTLTWSDHPEVNAFVDEIYERHFAEGRERIRKKHLKVVLLDLYVAWKEDPTLKIAYSRNANAYEGKSRYNALHISKLTIEVVDRLVEVGLVWCAPHFTGHAGYWA